MYSIVYRISIFYYFFIFCPLVLGQGGLSTEKEAEEQLRRLQQYVQAQPDSVPILSALLLKIARKEGWKLIELRTESILGQHYHNKSDFEQAIKQYLKAIELGETAGLEQYLAPPYNGLGIIYYELRELEKAAEYLRKAAEAKRKAGDDKYYAVIMSNLAAIYYAEKDFDQALAILYDIEPIMLQNPDSAGLSAVYNSIGSILHLAQGLPDSAIVYYQKAIDIAEAAGVRASALSPYHNLGLLYTEKKEFAKAIAYLEKAGELAAGVQNLPFDMALNETLSLTYAALGNYEKALGYKIRKEELKDSLFRREKQEVIQELNLRYETAKKEATIKEQEDRLRRQSLSFRNALLLVLVLLLLSLFIAYYFWQRKRLQQTLEQERSKIFQNIVHEIRTPLTLIQGPMEQLRQEYGIDEKELNWQLVRENSQKLTLMLNELLDASKLEKTTYKPEYKQGDLAFFVERLIDQFRPEAERKGIDLETDIAADMPTLRFPTNVLETIVGNLLGNALKYCPQGSRVLLKISYEEGQLFLVLTDTGLGIAEKEQKKIFERFYQSNPNAPGAGLGLPMVKDLTDLLKGTISLKSKKGVGTEVLVQFPLSLATHNERIDQEGANEQDKDLPLLLLVEDNEDIVLFLSQILSKNYRLLHAKDGEEGLSMALEQIPFIVVTDIMMPRKDGIALIQELKENELTRHIPIMALSAKASLESRMQGLSVGADVYLAKPFHPEELLLQIANLCRTVTQNQQLYQQQPTADGDSSKLGNFEQRLKGSDEYVNKIIDCIIAHIDQVEYSVNELADDLCISRSQLHRKLEALTGMSTTRFIKMVRLEKAKDLLEANAGNVTEIGYQCGFGSPSYFTRSFKEYFGLAPGHFLPKN